MTDHVVMTLLLIDPESPAPLTVRSNGPWVRLAVRLLASTLDRQLAEGRPPESNRLLAARAQELVAPATRGELAQNWAHLLKTARTPPPIGTHRVPLESRRHCRLRGRGPPDTERPRGPVTPAGPRGGHGELAARATAPAPSTNGAALAELAVALREVTAQLDPSLSL